MKKFFLILLIAFISFSISIQAQKIARFTIHDVHNEIATPVYVDLDDVTDLADSQFVLQKISGKTRTEVPFQIEQGYHRFLWFIIKKDNASPTQVYELMKGKRSDKNKDAIKVSTENGQLVLTANGRKVLQYNNQMVYPPAGVDTVFKRNGFIHPLWSPDGHVLTRLSPPDHPHHVGIWNPWTRVSFRGKTIDFWNLGEKQGTVRFANFISKTEGAVFGGFKALQEHVVLNVPPVPVGTVAMNEVWDVRVYNIGPKIWLWDFTSELNCATPDPVTLEEYRYGGFGFRATEDWNNQNSKMLTSEGKDRAQADATSARWCMIDGDVQGGHSGILFMDYPTNFNFPEPMRIWPVNANKRGDVFFSFSPTRNMSWPLSSDKSNVLKYRILVYEGSITREQAENVWQSFAHPPKIMIAKPDN